MCCTNFATLQNSQQWDCDFHVALNPFAELHPGLHQSLAKVESEPQTPGNIGVHIKYTVSIVPYYLRSQLHSSSDWQENCCDH